MKFIDSNNIPPDIVSAALTISTWCELNGYHDWEIYNVADRRLVLKLRDKLRLYKKYLRAANKGAECNAKVIQLQAIRTNNLLSQLNQELATRKTL